MGEDRLMQTMLLDFYGELLTEKQRRCLELHCNEDLSLSEIAEQCGISRQGVWDNIRRADAALREMEEKTGLVRRFTETQQGLNRLHVRLERMRPLCGGEAAKELALALRELDALMVRG